MWKHFVRATLIVVLLIGIVIVLVGGAIAVPKFDKSKLEFHAQPTLVLDKNNNTAIKIDTASSDYVSFDQISDVMKQALVATEDNRFYEHSGIDFRSLARTLLVDIWHRSAQQGASTITMQLAKMVYLDRTSEKALTIKIKEAILAAQIEHNFTKDEILEKYLNAVYLGDGQTGVQDAAEDYFGVPAKNLTLDQAALLAGLPQAPSAYDPYVNPQAALDRRNTVLDNMYKYGYITDQQRQQAEAQPLGVKKKSDQGSNKSSTPYGYYLDYILEEAKADGIDQEQILRGGVTVYTNMDQKLQASAEKAYQNNGNFPASTKDQLIQSGATFVDPKTGGLLAIVGARGEYHQQGFDYATMSKRSPGSSIKPLVDYGPAIDLGLIGPNSLLVDKPMAFGSNGYSPHDWDNWTTHRPGKVTVREALRESWNVPAVWTLDHILGGPDKGIEFAKRLGIPFDPSDYNLSVAIGGMKNGVSPLQMAQAYSAFDNGGVLNQAHAINKVVDANGDVVYQYNSKPQQVMKSSTASIMTDLMTTVVKSGTGVRAQISGVPVAGKTGTTEYKYGGDRDAWFVGYTPHIVGAIWMGYPNTDDNHYMRGESGYPAGLFSAIVSPAIRGQDPGQFPGIQSEPNVPQDTTDQTDQTKTTASVQLQGNFDQQSNSVTLTWTRIDGNGVKYTVFRKGTNEAIASVDAPMFIDRNPPLNQVVQYIVVATVGGQNTKSNTVSVNTGSSQPNQQTQSPDGSTQGNNSGNGTDTQQQPGNDTGGNNVNQTGNQQGTTAGDTTQQGGVTQPSPGTTGTQSTGNGSGSTSGGNATQNGGQTTTTQQQVPPTTSVDGKKKH